MHVVWFKSVLSCLLCELKHFCFRASFGWIETLFSSLCCVIWNINHVSVVWVETLFLCLCYVIWNIVHVCVMWFKILLCLCFVNWTVVFMPVLMIWNIPVVPLLCDLLFFYACTMWFETFWHALYNLKHCFQADILCFGCIVFILLFYFLFLSLCIE